MNTFGRTSEGMAVIALLLIMISTAAVSDLKPAKAIMNDVFNALSYLLRLSVDEESFVAPADPETTQTQIDLLFNSAKQLEKHAQGQNIGFEFLSQSFATAVNEFKYYYDAKRPEEARFFLLDLIQNCVACHARLPSARDFPLGESLINSVGLELLSLADQAQLQVAARRFHDALTSWETLFNDPTVEAADLDAEGHIQDYLVVAIRVLHDLNRPKKTLKKFLKRADLPFYLRYYIEIWIKRMDELKAELKGDPTVKGARQLFYGAHNLNVFPGSEEQTIYDLVASAILYRYLDQQGKRKGEEIAEAHYMLGVIEGRTLERAWTVPPFEHHFEMAIRSAPNGPLAKKSFAILEEYVLGGYGSPETMRRMSELRQLIGIPSKEGETDLLSAE